MGSEVASARWRAREADPAVVSALASSLSLPVPLARVMVGRGTSELDDARSYLAPSLQSLPDPLRLAGVAAAVERVVRAVRACETIGVFGDYDVDGVTSTTLLWEFLESLGATVIATIPDRLLEGYGLSRAGVDRLADAGATLVVTVDCGVTAHEEVAYANSRGIDVVVIDHHTVPVTLPAAVAVINPHRPDCHRGSEALCAVGVTFNLCLAVRRHLREQRFFSDALPEPDLRDLLDLVALGTVADVVPLVGENRVLVTQGLRILRQGKRVGMQALLDVSRVDLSRVDAGTLGFQLGPRVNAAGRLGDAMKAVRLLRSRSADEARHLAVELDEENRARRGIEKQIVTEAIAQVEGSALLREARVLVVGDERWHPGVVGIVASRLLERFGKPAVVVGEGGRGSARSVERFHMHDALLAVASTLAGFGGHAHAAGVRVPPGGFDRFRDALIDHAQGVLSVDDLQRVFVHDGELDLADVSLSLCSSLQSAAPFGRANPEPTFRFSGVQLSNVRAMGADGIHAKGTIDRARGIDVVAFGAAERLEELSGRIDLLATPQQNEFNGRVSVQLKVKDFVRSIDAERAP